jgi:DeoR/GlpR family transcriptional regulator of sugar metabolism
MKGWLLLIQKERLELILKELESKEVLSTKEIIKLTNTSRDTARRDIVKLSNNNLAQRTYGGIAKLSSFKRIDNYLKRTSEFTVEKKNIAFEASKLVEDNQAYFFDVSTTVSIMPQFLKNKNPLISVTNSIDIADQLLKNTKHSTRILGGKIDREKRAVIGTRAFRELNQYNFDIAFLGVAGFDVNGFYYAYEEDIDFKQKIREKSEKIVLLIDSSKVNHRQHFKVFDFKDVDIIVTDKQLPKEFKKLIHDENIKLLYAKESK